VNLNDALSDTFTKAFGKTPLSERLKDILDQAIQLSRFSDMAKLKEEAGDLLASTIQLCNECGWNLDDVVRASLAKIERRMDQYHSLGRKTVVALLGGAFNPITNGHIETAQFILNTSRTFDEVWLTPCYQHMFGKVMLEPEHRLKMCQIAAKKDGRIKVFDYEIKNQLKGDTYHFVRRLLADEELTNKYDFSIAIGMDNALTFKSWVLSDELERMIRFVVVPRVGYEFKPGWFLTPPHIYLHGENPVREISSTQVRKWLVEGDKENLSKHVDKGVLDYIVEHKLY
jgi:nicotinate (nicotinamide) nucleotide adenylyltransferase